MKRLVLVSFVLVAIACGGGEEGERNATATTEKLAPYVQSLHPGSPAAGAVIVDRTAEYNLVNSAIAAIDGSADVAWWTPSGEPQQSLTLRLPGDVRIDAVKLVRHDVKQTASAVMVETSGDGRAWAEMGSVQLAEGEPVTSVVAGGKVARLLRVTLMEGHEHGITALPELVVEGVLVRSGGSVDWDGTWRVNQRALTLRSQGGVVEGEVPFLRTTMHLFGRPRGGFLPFAWTQGNVVGYGALSLSSHGEMNGLWYWEFPYTWRLAETWFGRRESETADVQFDRRALALDFLREGHPSPFMEIGFDGSELDGTASTASGIALLRDVVESNPGARFRISVWDTVGAGLAAERIQAVRAALNQSGPLPQNVVFAVKAGNLLDQPPRNPITRALFDRVDLEAAPPEGGSTSPIVLR